MTQIPTVDDMTFLPPDLVADAAGAARIGGMTSSERSLRDIAAEPGKGRTFENQGHGFFRVIAGQIKFQRG